MRYCINCCIHLLPNDLHRQCFRCRGPNHNNQKCPVCKGENKIPLYADSKQMKLLAVLEVRTDHSESWNGFFCLRKGKLCSLIFGLIIMTLVMASYILTGAKHGLLLIPSPFHYGAFTSNPSLMDNESLSDMKDHYQPSKMNISYVKDYPSIKLIIDTITSKIEFITRQRPDLEELRKQEPHMFSVIPNKFLPNSKNPCWYEEYRGNTTTDPYATNSYALYSKRFRTIFDYLRKVFWNHLYHYKDKHYRLRCLPHFYIIGQPKCGTTDLYDRLRLHPDVRFSAIKEPHWWTRKRFGIIRLRDGFHDRYPVEDYLDLFDLAAHQIQGVLQSEAAKERSKTNSIIIGEASASTMWDNNAWIFFYDNSTEGEPPFLIQDFIHAFQPNAKLIIMLRDPVERSLGRFFPRCPLKEEDDDEGNGEGGGDGGRVQKDQTKEPGTLTADSDNAPLALPSSHCYRSLDLNLIIAIRGHKKRQPNLIPVTESEYLYRSWQHDLVQLILQVRLQVGLYVVYLLDWLTVFNKDQILVLRLEDHASNVKYTMHMVFQFLDLGPLSEKQEALITKSPASNTRRPEDRSLGPMLPTTKAILRDFYRPFNTKLAQVLFDDAFLWKRT
ncbi:carbohydrate sulfotransferase 15 [Limosa lapponica baueri]|uniref:Carbohydrate sulfotransferase 15 n=1 Tax=Limosa lapponica baueri TaxID=1758121 RepID=A0A2I0TJD2_LIMLA|nr:carbohydrate sulfotransferase 15 [Limosa lapponica baueri]